MQKTAFDPPFGHPGTKWNGRGEERLNDKKSFEATSSFDAICKNATDKALLVDIDGVEYWIPKSQIDMDSEVEGIGDAGTLVTSVWIAEQKGL